MDADSVFSKTSRAKSELRRQDAFTWREAAIDVRCRRFLGYCDWPWASLGAGETWTPVEEIHAMTQYPCNDDGELCSVCQGIRVRNTTEHQPNGKALIQSARKGCPLCRMILETFDTTPQSMEILQDYETQMVIKTDGRTLTAGYDEPVFHDYEKRYFTAYKHLELVTNRDRSLYRGKATTIEFMGNMLKECLQNHPNCPNALEQPLPPRLIDVGRPGGDELEPLRLWINPWHRGTDSSVDTTAAPSGVYVALSYCWGELPCFALNPENYEQMQEQIEMEMLPLTIQHAIEFTRGLGIRYIWIDALCIFQGQSAAASADWGHQSCQMDTIYQGAALVLGVATASNVHDGFLFDPYQYRDLVELPPLPTSSPTRHNPERSFIASPKIRKIEDTGVLHTRGWAFQEKILARRFAHLGREEIVFECDNGQHFEYHKSQGFPREPLARRMEVTPTFEGWHRLVEEYSRRQFSMARDNLIAVAGIAKHFAEKAKTSGLYLAGLWEANLARDLLWVVKGPGPRIDVAPSWSWACRRTEISFERLRLHICTAACASVVSTSVTNFPALYGYWSAGEIQLQGYLRKIFLRGEQGRYRIVGFQTSDPEVEGGTAEDTEHNIGMCLMDFPNAESSLQRLADRFSDSPFGHNLFEVWCLQLHFPGRGILLSTTGRGDNRFQRIGYYEYKARTSMALKDLESTCNPVAHADYLAEHPPDWIEAAIDAGQHDLVEDWFGDLEAVVTLI